MSLMNVLADVVFYELLTLRLVYLAVFNDSFVDGIIFLAINSL
jgi:hypothetical protein